MAVRETLELDIASALESINEVGSRLDNVAKAFGEQLQESLEEALASLPIIKVEADASEVTSEIEDAVEVADSDVVVEGDATDVTGSIDDAVDAADTDVVVDGDASGVTSEIEQAVDTADAVVVIDTDTSSVASDIEAAVSEANAEVDVTVNVDTGSAGSELDDLSGSADEAEASLGGAAVAGGLLGSKLTGGAGITGRATTAIAGLGASGAAAATGVGALVAGTGFLYAAAFENVAVTEQWERSLGDLGRRILDLDGGTTGFRGNLRQLAQDVGSSDEAVLIATQKFVAFQEAAGLADDQIVDNTQNIAVLAAQIRADNPALGDMDEIIRMLSRSLQRGGPRLQQYGIDLDTTSIQMRGAELAGKDLDAELTPMEKTAAGLSLAMEQLAPNMGKVADGMENAAIKSDRAKQKIGDAFEELGKPLVEPLTEALLDLAVAFESVAGATAGAIEFFGDFLRESRKVGDWARETAPFLAQLLGGAAPDGQSWLEYGRSVRTTTVDVDEYMDSAFATQIVQAGVTQTIKDTDYTVLASTDTWVRFGERLRDAQRQTELLQTRFVDLNAAAVANVPSVNAAFASLSAEVGTMQILADLDAAFAGTEQWTADMEAQLADGNDAIVALMAELGPEKSAILLSSYEGDLADLEVHLDRLYLAELNAQRRARETLVLHYLDAKGITGDKAQEIVDELGATLILEDPTAESVDAATKVIEDAEWATAANERARATWQALIDERPQFVTAGQSVTSGFVQGIYSAAADIDTAGSWLIQTVKKAADAKAVVNSPSLLFASLGKELVEGLAFGMNDTTLAVTSSQRLVSAVATPLERATLSAPAGVGGGGGPTNIAVTVPVTVTAGMTADDGRRVGEAAGQAAGMELRRMYRMEAMLA